jgi:hypothetical protein
MGALAVAAAASLLFCCLMAVMLRGGMAGFDGAVRMEVHELAAPWLTTCVEAMTLFGSLGVLTVLSGIAVVALVRAGRRGDPKFVFFVMAGAVILENATKFSIGRPRPPPFFRTDPTTYSYRSGMRFSHCASTARSRSSWAAATHRERYYGRERGVSRQRSAARGFTSAFITRATFSLDTCLRSHGYSSHWFR